MSDFRGETQQLNDREQLSVSFFERIKAKNTSLRDRLKIFHRVVYDETDIRVPSMNLNTFSHVDHRKGRTRTEDETFADPANDRLTHSVFALPSAKEVDHLLSQLEAKYTEFQQAFPNPTEGDIYFFLAYIQTILIAIHPFKDGVGRTTRIEMAYTSQQFLHKLFIFPKNSDQHEGPAEEFLGNRAEQLYGILATVLDPNGYEHSAEKLALFMKIPLKQLISEEIWQKQAALLREIPTHHPQ